MCQQWWDYVEFVNFARKFLQWRRPINTAIKHVFSLFIFPLVKQFFLHYKVSLILRRLSWILFSLEGRDRWRFVSCSFHSGFLFEIQGDFLNFKTGVVERSVMCLLSLGTASMNLLTTLKKGLVRGVNYSSSFFIPAPDLAMLMYVSVMKYCCHRTKHFWVSFSADLAVIPSSTDKD